MYGTKPPYRSLIFMHSPFLLHPLLLLLLLLLLQTELQDLLKPISNHIQEIQSFRERNRGSSLFNHLSAVSESIPALGWVAVVRKSSNMHTKKQKRTRGNTHKMMCVGLEKLEKSTQSHVEREIIKKSRKVNKNPKWYLYGVNRISSSKHDSLALSPFK